VTLLLSVLSFHSNAQTKKVQIEILNNNIDSLKGVVIEKSISISQYQNQIVSLKNQINEFEIKLKSLEEKNSNDLNNYKNKYSLLSDSINKLQFELSKFSGVRDISDGKFTENELQTIIDYLSTKIKFNVKDEVVVKKSITHTIVSLKLQNNNDSEYSIGFENNFDVKFAKDLNTDGSYEIFFLANVYGGGTSDWAKLYCLKLMPGNNNIVFEVDYTCPCIYQCGEPELENVTGNNIILKIPCFTENDGACCSSSSLKSEFVFKNNQLILKK
jgi:hypothetical protein